MREGGIHELVQHFPLVMASLNSVQTDERPAAPPVAATGRGRSTSNVRWAEQLVEEKELQGDETPQELRAALREALAPAHRAEAQVRILTREAQDIQRLTASLQQQEAAQR